MKNPRKFRGLYIFLLIVFCAGAICGGVYKNVLKERGYTSNSSKLKITNSYEYDYEKVDSIDIDADIANLKIKKGDELTVEYKYTDGYVPKVQLSGKTLCIEQENPSMTIAGNIDSDITITIPKKASFDIIDIEVSLGNIDISDVESEEIEIDASLGNVDIKRVEAGEIEIEASLGSVDVSGEFDSLDVSASLGSINVKTDKPEKEVDLDLTADLGSITVNGKKFKKY